MEPKKWYDRQIGILTESFQTILLSLSLSLSANEIPICPKEVARDLGLLYSKILNSSKTVSQNASRSCFSTGITRLSSIDMRRKLSIGF